jgi:CheY-like chemotaxis protein
MSIENVGCAAKFLLVEDNPGDVRLTCEALRESKVKNNLSIVGDGLEAMDFLRREGKHTDAPRPDVILLDLNLPRKNELEVLEEIEADPRLKRIWPKQPSKLPVFFMSKVWLSV